MGGTLGARPNFGEPTPIKRRGLLHNTNIEGCQDHPVYDVLLRVSNSDFAAKQLILVFPFFRSEVSKNVLFLLDSSCNLAMRVPVFTGQLPICVAPPSTASLHSLSVLTRLSSRLRQPETPRSVTSQSPFIARSLSTYPKFKMSQNTFSNTEVPADKSADPYTATNKSEPELKEKVQDLISFIESCKFGMMTTRIESTGLLTSRCMALAGKVRSPSANYLGPPHTSWDERMLIRYMRIRRVAALIYSSTPTPNPARQTI